MANIFLFIIIIRLNDLLYQRMTDNVFAGKLTKTNIIYFLQYFHCYIKS